MARAPKECGALSTGAVGWDAISTSVAHSVGVKGPGNLPLLFL